ncbi:MAG: acetyl-CoA carboxylase, carboxyltransferase subunit beta [Candidatus Omnitrophota bacterium]|nr:acetyl-CoA carboxylase, carboxyltransferase subunit beta [Candidatus Omnitrophota bacterium]
MRIFKKTFQLGKKKNIPDGLWSKCPSCSHLIFNKILQENLKVCPKCDYHFLITCWERIALLVEPDSFEEFCKNFESLDPLNFSNPKSYKSKLKKATESTGLKSAAVIGAAKIGDKNIALGVTDSRFIMGSMGAVLGEKIAYLAEYALKTRRPLIIVSGSGGGARMYEGLFSLMQMAKTSGALARLKEENIPFISVLTNPTMAGVLASFAGLGDVTVAEPKALIGFTGPRVIKQTIKQDLPKGFQTSEFNLDHGLIDIVSHRKDLKSTVANLIGYLIPAGEKCKEDDSVVSLEISNDSNSQEDRVQWTP